MTNFADRMKMAEEMNPMGIEDARAVHELLFGMKIEISVDEFIFDSMYIMTEIVGLSADQAADFILDFLMKNKPEAVGAFIKQIMERRK